MKATGIVMVISLNGPTSIPPSKTATLFHKAFPHSRVLKRSILRPPKEVSWTARYSFPVSYHDSPSSVPPSIYLNSYSRPVHTDARRDNHVVICASNKGFRQSGVSQRRLEEITALDQEWEASSAGISTTHGTSFHGRSIVVSP
jgi:hypothetical protein